MDEAKLRGLMGLCVRARQATFGEDGCMKAIRGKQSGMVLVDGEASAATREKYESACRTHGAILRVIPPGLIHEATGRPGVAMVVSRGGLAEQIRSLTAEDGGEQQMNPGNKCGGASVE